MLLVSSSFTASANTSSASSCRRSATDGGKKRAPAAGFGDGVREREPLPRPANPTCWTVRCESVDEARVCRSDMRRIWKLLQVSRYTKAVELAEKLLLLSADVGATRWRAGRGARGG